MFPADDWPSFFGQMFDSVLLVWPRISRTQMTTLMYCQRNGCNFIYACMLHALVAITSWYMCHLVWKLWSAWLCVSVLFGPLSKIFRFRFLYMDCPVWTLRTVAPWSCSVRTCHMKCCQPSASVLPCQCGATRIKQWGKMVLHASHSDLHKRLDDTWRSFELLEHMDRWCSHVQCSVP